MMTPDFPLRHELTRSGNEYRYGPWHIADAGWLRPSPRVDVDWWHDDFDGAPDAVDNRCGSAETLQACILEIHDCEDDLAECVA